MAIRPVDLQLAYLAAPQNAAQSSAAQEAPQAAQQAAQAAFAAQVREREEQIEAAQHTEGNLVRPRGERERSAAFQGDGRRKKQPQEHGAPPPDPLGLAGDGEHFIDVTV